jgi:cleavage stimulation factor subunit 3
MLTRLNSAQVSGNTWEEQQKMDVLRRTYQRAVSIPLENVEAIWSEYNYFEHNLNKMTVRQRDHSFLIIAPDV